MNVEILHQVPGKTNLTDELRNALVDGQFNRLRIMVAYVSWAGVRLIHGALENFYDAGNNVAIVLGISEGLSESHAIRYLVQRFPNADISLFHVPVNRYIFHPKIYAFDNSKESMIFIGSNNLTTGGLFGNSECCVKLSLEKKRDKKIFSNVDKIWDEYSKPKKPFKSGNSRKIDEKLLLAYSGKDKLTRQVKKKVKPSVFDKLFPSIEIEWPVIPYVKLPKSKSVRSKGRKSSGKSAKSKGRNNLFLEIMKETGAGGTQVQIPKMVIDGYFDVPDYGHQTIEVKIENDPVRPAVICHFPNNTHRISFPEIANVRRPLLMEFGKAQKNIYTVRMIKGKTYSNLIKQCTNKTRKGARRWEIF